MNEEQLEIIEKIWNKFVEMEHCGDSPREGGLILYGADLGGYQPTDGLVLKQEGGKLVLSVQRVSLVKEPTGVVSEKVEVLRSVELVPVAETSYVNPEDERAE